MRPRTASQTMHPSLPEPRAPLFAFILSFPICANSNPTRPERQPRVKSQDTPGDPRLWTLDPSADRKQCPGPARLQEEIGDPTDGAGTPPAGARRAGPVDEKRASFQIRRGHGPPEAAVVGVITIVSEGEIGLRRHTERGDLVAPTQPLRELRLVMPDARVRMERARLVLAPAVDEDGLVADFHRVRGKRHGPLDEIPPRVFRELEHDDIAAAYRAAGEKSFESRQRERREDELVHDDVVSDEDGLLHRGTRNDEGLQQKRAHEKGEHDRHENG